MTPKRFQQISQLYHAALERLLEAAGYEDLRREQAVALVET